VDPHQFLTVVVEGSGFVRISVAGAPTAPRLFNLLQRIVVESESRALSRVLVDATEVTPPTPTAEKFDIGAATARVLAGRVRLAVFALPEHVDHFFETVARNRGADVGVFTDEKTALAWLIGRT
jgi:hypothetical protein